LGFITINERKKYTTVVEDTNVKIEEEKELKIEQDQLMHENEELMGKNIKTNLDLDNIGNLNPAPDTGKYIL